MPKSTVTLPPVQSAPAGVYPLRLDSVKEFEDRDKNPALSLTFTIPEGPYKGVEVHDRLFFQESYLWRVQLLCRAMGVDVPQGDVVIDTDEWLGKVVVAECDERFETGGSYMRITRYVVGNRKRPKRSR